MPHRHREVSRIEGFSDAVFGFAITLLVVSLEVPRTFDELVHVMRGFPAFAVSFVLIFQIWRRHYLFFRTYDIEDSTVVVLTGALLFVVLFYVYPLKFVWSLALAQLQGAGEGERIRSEQWPLLMEIYGAGVIAIFGLLALLYAHAYRLRAQLGLSAGDTVWARVQVMRNAAIALWGVLSMLICVAGGRAWLSAAGFVYFGIGISEWALGEYNGRMQRKLGRVRT